MNLSELKEKLNTHRYVPLPMLFVGDSDSFLINEYLTALAGQLKADIKRINNIEDLYSLQGTLVDFNSNTLYVYVIKKDEKILYNNLQYLNVVLIGDTKVDEKTIDSVVFPKLENWQIESYVSTLCKGLKDDEVEWLCKQADYDINRLDKECQKLSLFNEKEQREIFTLSMQKSVYNRLKTPKIFNLTNAVMKRNIVEIKDSLQNIENSDIESIAFVNILLKNFRSLLDIYCNPKSCAEILGMSEKQYQAIKYTQTSFTKEEVLKNYTFLLGLDYRVKMGMLDLTNADAIMYIVSHVLERERA